MSVQDRELASQWLAEAARIAGVGAIADEFTERVFRRLEKGAREYGADNFLAAPLEQLLGEGAEEGDDLAGWAVVAALRLFRELDGLDPDSAHLAQSELLEAAGLGLRAWLAYRRAREAVVGS